VYRNYALRRIRDAFKEYKTLENPELIEEHMKEGLRNFNIIKRQASPHFSPLANKQE